jgi:hypothetical protein
LSGADGEDVTLRPASVRQAQNETATEQVPIGSAVEVVISRRDAVRAAAALLRVGFAEKVEALKTCRRVQRAGDGPACLASALNSSFGGAIRWLRVGASSVRRTHHGAARCLAAVGAAVGSFDVASRRGGDAVEDASGCCRSS